MNRFIYMPVADAVPVPTERVINPLATIETDYVPVYLRFHFIVNDILIDVQTLEITLANQRACDLVGTCLMFCKLAELVYPCAHPYLKDGIIWLDLATELTQLPLSSGDLLNMYNSYFNNSGSAKRIQALRHPEK